MLVSLTASAVAQGGPAASSTATASKNWLVSAMDASPACHAPAASPAEVQPPGNAEIVLTLSDTRPTSAEIRTSSGDAAFDQRALTCFRSLPSGISNVDSVLYAVEASQKDGAIFLPNPPPPMGRPHTCGSYYPIRAMQRGEEGATVLAFRILTDGSIAGISVHESSGHEDLDDASVACAKYWRYKPAMQNGTPVEVSWLAKVEYRLPSPEMPAPLKACVDPTPDELKDATLNTVLFVYYQDGAVVSDRIAASSGSGILDNRLEACRKSQPADPNGPRGNSIQSEVYDWKSLH